MKSEGSLVLGHSLVGLSIIYYAVQSGYGFWQALVWGMFWEWWAGKLLLTQLFLPHLG